MKINNETLRRIIKEEIFDYYSRLELPVTDDQGLIKKSYRKMAMKTHPDKGGKLQDFQGVQQSYAILSDTEKKAELDKGLLDSAIKQNKEKPGMNYDGTTALRLSDENLAALRKIVGSGQDSQQGGGSPSGDNFDQMMQQMKRDHEKKEQFYDLKNKIFNAVSDKSNEWIKQGNYENAQNFMKIMQQVLAAKKMEDLKNYMGFAR
tara:strand:+ start:931 stop:1545 length:615 start_codon:yes stop_codon:yes gene_type:complete